MSRPDTKSHGNGSRWGEGGREGCLLQTNNYGLPLLCGPARLSELQDNPCVSFSTTVTHVF